MREVFSTDFRNILAAQRAIYVECAVKFKWNVWNYGHSVQVHSGIFQFDWQLSVTSHQRFRISKSNELTKAELVMECDDSKRWFTWQLNMFTCVLFYGRGRRLYYGRRSGLGEWNGSLAKRLRRALHHRIYSWIFFSKHYPDLNDMENPYRPACE